MPKLPLIYSNRSNFSTELGIDFMFRKDGDRLGGKLKGEVIKGKKPVK